MPVRLGPSAAPHAVHVMVDGVLRRCKVYVMDGGVLKTVDPVVTVGITPQTASGSVGTFNFPGSTVGTSGGTPTAYSWSVSSLDGLATWTVFSGQGTATAVIRVSDVQGSTTAQATVKCVVTVDGVQHTGSAVFSYTNTSQA